MVNCPATAPDPLGHERRAATLGPALRSHAPGPARGTATAGRPGPTAPERAPVGAPARPIAPPPLSLDLALEAVTGVERVALVEVVVGEVADGFDVVGIGVVAGAVVVVALGVEVVVGTGAGECAVTVKRSTIRRSGLDHISTWPPAREWGLLAMRVRR